MSAAILNLFRRMVALAKVAPRRSMLQFAQEELTLPTGDYRNRKFRVDRNPFTRLLIDELDSGRWTRHFITGPQQSGKTLMGSNLPLMYHLFEIGETVIYAVPSLDMVEDKWNDDILPVIEASRYRELLPAKGSGSRGGKVKSVRFGNGANLKFMTAGGGDKARAGKTSRVLVVTELDEFDKVGGGSREGDKFSQVEGRTSGSRKPRIYGECTVSFKKGKTWSEYTAGTQSRIAIRCPHCRKYVTPEREQLVGWQGAADVIAAGENARVACPSCGAMWTEGERVAANHDCLLVHRGQEIVQEEGAARVTGPLPRTFTLGFRWTAINNLLVPISVTAQKEWLATNAPDTENSDKVLKQFTWAMPHEPDEVEVTELQWGDVAKRGTKDLRGKLPAGTVAVGVGVDLGKRLCNWTAVALKTDKSWHVFDYGVLEVQSDLMETEAALKLSLRDFRDSVCLPGWEAEDGSRVSPDVQLVDSGWFTDVAYDFCRESGPNWMPSKGVGDSRERRQAYRQPKKLGEGVSDICDSYHISRLRQKRIKLLEADADQWKGRVHAGFAAPMGEAGAATLFQGDAKVHQTFGKHIVAEKQEEVFEPGKGNVIRFKSLSRNNHFLDSTTMARIAVDWEMQRRKKKQRQAGNWRPAQRPSADGEAEAEEDEVRRGDGWFASRKKR